MIPPATSVGRSLDGVERLDHTHDGTHKSEHRAKCDEQTDPAQTRLHAAGLNRTVGNDGFFNAVQTLVVTVQTLIEDRCHRTAFVAANFLGSFDTAFFQRFLDLGDQFLGVDGRKAQVKHTLDSYGKTEYQAEEHRKHPLPTAFEELLHQHLVHRLAFGKLSFRSRSFGRFGRCGFFDFFNDCGFLGCRRSRLLGESINSTKREDGDCYNQKKFFHGCLIKILIS